MSNNNEIFMPENKSNKASIIVAVIAICLILGGVYLLNQSFSSDKSADTKTSSSTPTKTETAKKKEAKPVVEEKPVTNETETATTTTPATTTTAAPATTPTTAPATTPTEEKKVLTPNQIIAKVLKIKSNGETVFQIQECGLKDATICKAPNTFNLSGVKAQVDKIYLVSGSISEENGRMSLENITIKENPTT